MREFVYDYCTFWNSPNYMNVRANFGMKTTTKAQINLLQSVTNMADMRTCETRVAIAQPALGPRNDK
jgi:hypothetical protein